MVRRTPSVSRTATGRRQIRLEAQAAALGPVAALRQQPIRRTVPRCRFGGDVGGEAGRGWLLVPVNGRQVVAHELLVEARLGTAWRVLAEGPETGGVWCEDLIDQHGLAGRGVD